jgi:hypothetical protein
MLSGTRSSSFTVVTSVAQPSWKRSEPLHRSAIRGNNDKGAWASSLPTYDVLEVGIHAFYVLHNSRSSTSIRMPLASRPSCPVTLTSL